MEPDFFYGHGQKHEEDYYPFPVTNRHILEPTAADGYTQIFLKLNKVSEEESTDYPAD